VKRITDHAAFIAANTSVMAPPLVPEVLLHLAHEAVPVWQKTEEELGEMGLPPPFWAFAWAGGQALARYVLDRPETVAGQAVTDLAAGSGLVGLAALKAGAREVLAADIDPFACSAIAVNARLNGVSCVVTADNLLAGPPPAAGVVLVGDLFYEKGPAAACLSWLEAAQAKGLAVLVGDPGRSYFPRERFEQMAEYMVPVTRELEDSEIKRTAVWRLAAPAAGRSY
jgi:predicted nicotinamide N-methyase